MPDLPLSVRPSKIVCIGKNFRKHAAEMQSEVPEEPLFFFKPPSSLLPSGEPIQLPVGVGRVDHEGEIAFVIGETCRHVPEERAWKMIEAVLPLNDVTARILQRNDNQWTRAKGFDTFCPVGTPVPLEQVDVDSLIAITRVNGEERQRGEITNLVFSVPHLISYISRIMTLEKGDLLSTGAPQGVGPLHPGDVVEVEIPGVGVLRNPVVEEEVI